MREIRIIDDGTLTGGDAAPARLTLTFDQRRHSRARVRLDDGTEAGLMLPRGTPLAHGTRLRDDAGRLVVVQAAPETLSSVESTDPLAIARAAYHLGNRHVALEIAPGRLRYQHDHVLDDLVRTLGLRVDVIEAPFQPEPGAYSSREGGGHAHGTAGHGHHHHP